MGRPNTPRDPLERTAWVQARLKVAGSSFANIGRRVGMSRRTIANAMFAPHYRAEIAIAEELGVEISDLFPERYGPEGDRIPAVRSSKSTGRRSARNVEDRRAL